MAFTPGVTSAARRGRLFAIAGQSLFMAGDASALEPPLGDVADGDLYLGELDGAPCFARAIADATAAPPDTRAVPLRQLFGAVSDDVFGVAGRALGFAAWDRDHH